MAGIKSLLSLAGSLLSRRSDECAEAGMSFEADVFRKYAHQIDQTISKVHESPFDVADGPTTFTDNVHPLPLAGQFPEQTVISTVLRE